MKDTRDTWLLWKSSSGWPTFFWVTNWGTSQCSATMDLIWSALLQTMLPQRTSKMPFSHQKIGDKQRLENLCSHASLELMLVSMTHWNRQSHSHWKTCTGREQKGHNTERKGAKGWQNALPTSSLCQRLRAKCGLEETSVPWAVPSTVGTSWHSWAFAPNKQSWTRKSSPGRCKLWSPPWDKLENMYHHRWPSTSSSNRKTSWSKNIWRSGRSILISCLQPFQCHVYTVRSSMAKH